MKLICLMPGVLKITNLFNLLLTTVHLNYIIEILVPQNIPADDNPAFLFQQHSM